MALTILLMDKSPSVPLLQRGKTTSRFTCPASGATLTDSMCRLSRRASPALCANCLIPLADDAREVAQPLCSKCGRAFSYQEGVAGFTTCEHCGEGDAA